jgi:hypothetical protein
MFYVCYSAVSRVAVHIRRNDRNEKGVRGENAKPFTQVDTPRLEMGGTPRKSEPRPVGYCEDGNAQSPGG